VRWSLVLPLTLPAMAKIQVLAKCPRTWVIKCPHWTSPNH
jgi:hypothetical protein